MSWGVATALLDAGREPGQLGLFEVNEAWLPKVAAELHPRLLLLANLFRDQLDRYGELELLADRWAEVVGRLDGHSLHTERSHGTLATIGQPYRRSLDRLAVHMSCGSPDDCEKARCQALGI